MKALNIIDLGVQSLILGIVLIVTLVSIVTGGIESSAFGAMYGAILLGPWQLVSSLVTCIARGLYFRWRLIHLISSIAYIVILSAGVAYAKDMDPSGFVRTVGAVFGFGIPAVLAVFYYVITVKSFQQARAGAIASTRV
jgi:hypothetical protein